MTRTVARMLLVALLAVAVPLTAFAAAPAPPAGGGGSKPGGGGGGGKPSGGGGGGGGGARPRRPAKKVPAKDAIRIHAGGAFRTNSEHPYAPGTWSMLGFDYEKKATGGLFYAPGLRWDHTAVNTDLYEGLMTLRYKFGKEKKKLLPYAVGGAGLGVMTHPAATDFGFDAKFGGGVSYRVLRSFRLGAELTGTYLLMFNDPGNGTRDEIGLIQLAIVPEFRF